jgi:hypothetical protein
MNREPLLTVAGITSVVGAVIALLAAFGLDLSSAQQVAIVGVVAVVAPVVVAVIARRKVTPVVDPPPVDGPQLVK